MRLLHTADWQIGKPFRQFGDKNAVLRQARLDAIEAIGRLAVEQGAAHVLVAGDIYDSDQPSPATLREPIERIRRFPGVRWHVIPGNHDPHRPKGVWDRLREMGTPGNMTLHLEPRPFEIGAAAILPAVLTTRHETRDLTEHWDHAETAPGLMRIGIAHGSAVAKGFGHDGEATNPIHPARDRQARLDYLALGDWHRTLCIGPRTWYAGTPEPDRQGGQETGQVLLVEIEGPGAPPRVEPHMVGRFRWRERAERIDDEASLADLERRLRAMPDLSQTVLRLSLAGGLPLAAQSALEDALAGLAAAAFSLDVERSGLSVVPGRDDLEALDFDGVLRRAAEHLAAETGNPSLDEDGRRRAGAALVELHLLAGRA